MRRALFLAAFMVASSSLSGVARAQSADGGCHFGDSCSTVPAWNQSTLAPRDGAVEQAVQNTVAASLKRRGFDPLDSIAVSTYQGVHGAIQDLATSGAASPNPVVAVADWTWQQVLRGIQNGMSLMGWPFDLGKSGGNGPEFQGGGGSFGAGGAGSGWGDSDFNALDCGNLKFELDASGNLIIPAVFPQTGTAINFNDTEETACSPFTGSPCSRNYAKTPGALGLWSVHRWNSMFRRPETWLGAIGTCEELGLAGSEAGGMAFASLAWRDPATGQLVPREYYTANCAPTTMIHNVQTHTNGVQHKPCPEFATGGDADYYGQADDGSSDSFHTCITFVRNGMAGWSGYAINKRTTIANPVSGWPGNYPKWIRACPLASSFIQKLADALLKKASLKPGYAGRGYAPVEPEDARPNDARVADLQDNPSSGAAPQNPDGDQDGPAPPTPTPPSTSVDLGPNPNTPAPTLDEPSTGIMDPIFNWLPDLPSLTLNTASATCPTWDLDLTSFGGASWHWTVDKQCELAETVREPLGALMIVIFGIGAALIILRA